MTIDYSGRPVLNHDVRQRLAALRRGVGTAVTSIVRSGTTQGPLSAAQERMWFLHEFVRAPEAYTIAGALHITGEFDAAALRWALGRVIDRHEALRSVFTTVNGQVVQCVEPGEVVLEQVDGGQLDDWVRVELSTPFDLTTGPLVRARIVRTGPGDHAVVVAVHHIVGDGWSMGVLIREVTAYYREYIGGEAADLPELPAQYLDYAAWQRRVLTGSYLSGMVDHWREAVAQAPLVVDLPTDHPRPSMQSFRGATVRRMLGGADARGYAADVDRFAKQRGATPFMVLLAGFGTLISRWAEVDDLLVATPIANRNRAEIEPLIGFFVNTLVMRVRTAGYADFGELVARVRQAALDAYAHQDLPFAKLVEELAPERDLSRNPVAQVMFILQNAADDQLTLPGSQVVPVPVQTGTAKFDLTLSVTPTPDGLEAEWEYATDLFERRTVESMADAFEVLLTAALVAPERAVSELPLCSETAIAAAWEAGRGPRRDVPDGTTLDLIARQVRSCPDAVAVRIGVTTLTYHQLWSHACGLAADLRDRGIGPDIPVGVAMRRGPELVPALLGIWLAGGAYLPLDPDHPEQRLTYILDDAARAGLRIVLADPGVEMPESGDSGPEIVRFTLPAQLPEVDCTPSAAPGNLAYVIYTSGSTGRPKGVLAEHGALVNRLAWMQHEYGLRPEHRVYQKTNYTFDVSIWEFFWPLTTGATVVLATPGVQREPAAMVAEMSETAVTHVHFVPTALSALLGVASLAEIGLELLVCSGEALSPELITRVHDDCGLPIRNLYGPTEAAIDVSFATCTAADIDEGTSVPIGTPVANTDLHVLDATMVPVPDGMPGELYIGGIQLARGYLGNLELTEQRFITHPATGERLYRTGDRARRRPDHALEYRGRTDHQVKLNGYRIELGEIEAALRAHPTVRDAAVIAERSATGGGTLRGYVTAELEFLTEEMSDNQVDQWREVFDDTYSEGSGAEPADFDLSGWKDSYTGAAIPVADMREWVDDIVGLIRRQGGTNFLELGSGTGLLLFELAPAAASYSGLDVSWRVLDQVRGRLGHLTETVRLICGSADDIAEPGFGGRLAARPDCIVLNSVAQYFPTIDYLETVLDAAAELVEPGGSIVIGDVRNLALLPALASSIENFQDPEQSAEIRQARAARRLADEAELAIDPVYFLDWAQRQNRHIDVWITPKRMTADNELSRYRYNVVLTVAPEVAAPAPARALDYTDLGCDADRLGELLDGTAATDLVVTGIPNARLSSAPGALTIPALLERDERIHLTYDLRYPERDHLTLRRCRDAIAVPAMTTVVEPAEPLSNTPLLVTAARSLPARLREHLELLLPGYMVPVLTVLPELPMTSSGKVDRDRLPRPDQARGRSSVSYVEPRTETERIVAAVWQDVLGVQGVGALDRFFQIGGDSIRAVQVVARLAEAGHELQVSELFEHQTVEALAALTDSRVGETRQPLAPLDLRTDEDRLAGIAGVYPLAPLQQHMLDFRTVAGSGLFTMQRVLQFSGPLDMTVARRAWAETVAANQLLRTSLHDRGSGTVQVVRSDADPAIVEASMTYEDWCDVPVAEREARTRAVLDADRSMGFDAAQPVPMRHRIIRITDSAGIWILSCDYRRLDGWSFSLCMGNFLDAYADALQCDEISSTPETFDYGMYAAWIARERENLAHEQWWRGRVDGAVSHSALSAGTAADWTRSAFGVIGATVPVEVGRGLATRARRLNVTVASLFQSAWALALLRNSGRTQVLFGVTTSGRPPQLPGIERAVGVFMNTVPAPTRITASSGLDEWLQEQGRWFARLVGHDFLTPDEIARSNDMPTGTCLFDTYFVYQNTPRYRASTAAADLRVDDRPLIITARQEHAVRIDIYPYPGGEYEVLQSAYDAAVDVETQQRLLHDFVCYLHELVIERRGRTAAAMLSADFGHRVEISSTDVRLRNVLEHL